MAAVKKHVASPEEVTNDPSLKWHPYLYGEPLFCDDAGKTLRFVRYEKRGIRVADLSLRELNMVVDPLMARRPSVAAK